MSNATAYKVLYLGHFARRAVWGDPHLSLESAERGMRSLKNRGMTSWIETTAGEFVPVKGARRKPAESST